MLQMPRYSSKDCLCKQLRKARPCLVSIYIIVPLLQYPYCGTLIIVPLL